jgi:Cytochrome c7 and related cytochrome c
MANIFPRWTNLLPLKIAFCGGAAAIGIVAAFTAYATPKSTVVGYQPSQPIPFSHKIHVDQLGLDCRYCHSFVDVSSHSNLPSANTCWNCHQHVQKDSPKLEPLHRAMDKNYTLYDGKPIKWVKVHKAPDYVYFNHSAHVNRGVSCKSCHGQVDQMEVVYQAESHSMGFCLECHRNPENHVRPLEEVFNLKYDPVEYLEKNIVINSVGQRITDPKDFGKELVDKFKLQPRESCATCHH